MAPLFNASIADLESLSSPPVVTTTSSAAVVTPTDRLEALRQRHEQGEALQQTDCDVFLAHCVAHDEWDLVLDVLDIMQEHGLSQVRSSFQASLVACYDLANAASAQDLLMAMEQAGYPPDRDDWDRVIRTLCRKEATEPGWLTEARTMLDNHPDVSLGAYEAVLAGLMRARQWTEAARLLRKLEVQTHTRPTAHTYQMVIDASIYDNQLEMATQILQAALYQKVIPPAPSFELVIAALSRRLQWRRAVQLLDFMYVHAMTPTIHAYQAILTACSKAREDVQARNLLVQMRKQGMQPDILCFNSVMSASANAGRWKEALAILDQCHRVPGVQPDIYTYTNAIRACAKGKTVCSKRG
jgi:pentatricopeptide repeat protein